GQRTRALVRTEQVAAFHPRKARTTLAIGTDFAFRTKRQLAFSNVTNPFEGRGAIPNLPEALLTYIPGRHGQLYASIHFAVRRKITTIVACAARQVFVSRIFNAARNCASKNRGCEPVRGGN